MTRAIGGTIWTATISSICGPLAGNRRRAKAYEARTPKTRQSTVVVPARIRLLSNAR
jgi:hypothetical protein